jgi:acyl-CoA synthetase (AMP-forming)/AMP-acid ligase II/thioesterase domain-containing protein/acyl carrier protein
MLASWYGFRRQIALIHPEVPLAASIWSTFDSLAHSVGEVEAILAPAREPLRFAELPDRLRAVRNTLAQCGAGRGDRVVSVLPRGPETAACYLGVAACSIYVPLNPDYKESEFTAHLTKLRPKAVILPDGGGGAARRCAETLGLPIIDLVAETTKPAGWFRLVLAGGPLGEPDSKTPSWNEADDVALVLLTSGSTSEPKLVPLKVRHLLAYAQAAGKHYGFGSGDRCLHVMPMFHGHGLMSSLLIPLANGSGVICSPDFDIPSFFQHMRTLRPTWYSAASSIHHAILAGIDDYRDIAREARLRFIRSGSGRLDPKVMAGLEEAFGAPMLERYGMSETGGTLTSNPMPPGLRKPGTVGTQMFNEVAIVDESGELLGSNRDGEVVARGPSVFDGYLDNPEANAAAFVNGWFRTGDLGRFDDDGYLTLIGRTKDVINRGGEKIGTLEVEAALAKHPAVEEVCVFAIPHPSLGEEVAAAVTILAGRTVSKQEIRTHARGWLTDFKVPREVFILPSLPKGATNKIRRDQVAQICQDLLAKSQSTPASDKARSWSSLEQEVARVWKRVLELETIRLDDDFFLVGGDSLKAYELFAQLRKRHQVSLGLRHIFNEAATVAGMARLIERARQGKADLGPASAGLVSIRAEGERPPLFAVPGSGGNPVGFIHLGRLLDARQPLIGIESRGIDGTVTPLARVEDIAADNIGRIREMQPHGPYFLTGACYGGRVASEMARQLEAAGEPIGLLVMLDPSPPFFNDEGRPRGTTAAAQPAVLRQHLGRFILDRITMHAKTMMALRGAERAAFVRDKIATVRSMITHRALFQGVRSDLYQRAVYAANRQAGLAYVPGSFSGPTVLCFTSGRKRLGERNYRLDWLGLVPQVGAPSYVTGNDSGDMLNPPHVDELADLMNRWLDDAHAKTPAPGADRSIVPASVK